MITLGRDDQERNGRPGQSPVRIQAGEKAHTGRRPDGSLVYSFRGLLAELATLTKNTVRLPGSEVAFEKLPLPTPIQAEALSLLGLSPSL